MRIDQFLWCVRQFKSRNLASSWCKKSNIKINDMLVKASKEVIINDTLHVRKNQIWRTYKIIDIPKGRMASKLVNLYLSETTDKHILDRENLKRLSCRIERIPGKGRPTKKERREIDDLNKKNQKLQ